MLRAWAFCGQSSFRTVASRRAAGLPYCLAFIAGSSAGALCGRANRKTDFDSHAANRLSAPVRGRAARGARTNITDESTEGKMQQEPFIVTLQPTSKLQREAAEQRRARHLRLRKNPAGNVVRLADQTKAPVKAPVQ
jgi:hypothetical protein